MKIVYQIVFSFFVMGQAFAQHSYQPTSVQPQVPNVPAFRQVTTPDGRVVPFGQGGPQVQNRIPNSYETTRMPARLIYLNGKNVSSLKNQELENVYVKIDEYGNVHMTAPQYEVATDSSYHPLLPSELPRFPKDKIQIENLPQGVFSKEQVKLPEATALLPKPPSGRTDSQTGAAPEEVPPPISPPSKN